MSRARLYFPSFDKVVKELKAGSTLTRREDGTVWFDTLEVNRRLLRDLRLQDIVKESTPGNYILTAKGKTKHDTRNHTTGYKTLDARRSEWTALDRRTRPHPCP